MSYKNGSSFADTWKDLLQIIGVNVLLAVFLYGCSSATSFPTATIQPDMPLPTASLESVPPVPEIMWRKAESPLFPANWPPTSETVWVRYTFAYGSNPANLIDGNYVTNPLSKTEWRAGGISTTIVLSNDMTQAAVQGVLPLDSQTRIILENEKQVSAYCLRMTELPNPNMPETKEMLVYYHVWFKYNGAFLDLIRNNHAGFIDWVVLNE